MEKECASGCEKMVRSSNGRFLGLLNAIGKHLVVLLSE